MKRAVMVGICLSTLVAGMVLPVSAPASTRWRADGNACQTQGANLKFLSYSSLGLEIGKTGNRMGAYCAIPTGPGLIDLGDGSNTIDQVNVRVAQELTSGSVWTALNVHDINSASVCGCGQTSGTIAAGGYSNRKMTFDCGACSYDMDWAVAVNVDKYSPDGEMLIKLISVYDE